MGVYKPYKVLKEQIYSTGDFSIVPIRNEDRYLIMQWRNEQIYHLRQNKPLTKKDQDNYFKNVVSKLFDQDEPDQLLFSFLKDEKCIGYGGLVHINWIDKNAEVSFVMDTALERHLFKFLWQIFLNFIEIIAFEELKFHKLFTFSFNLRPHFYEAIENIGYKKEAILNDHCLFQGNFIDVIIHSKIRNDNMVLLPATDKDAKLLFDWANDSSVRLHAFNNEPIKWEEHLEWFQLKLKSVHSKIFILYLRNKPTGQIRFDYIKDCWEIDYSIDKLFRGKGLGKMIIELGISKFTPSYILKAKVKKDNVASLKVFQQLGFEQVSHESLTITFQKKLN